jgi:hypothetical protein
MRTLLPLRARVLRWIQRLQEQNYTSPHRQGRKHNNSDALPQQPCREECKHYQKFEARAEVKQVRALAAVAAGRMDQLKEHDMEPILQEAVETGSGAHSLSYPMSTGGSFPGCKAAGASS